MSNGIGFIGLGDIGGPIAARIQEVLGPIAVWNRTPAKADPLVKKGARLLASPHILAAACDLIALCLTSDDPVDAVLFGQDGVFRDGAPHPDLIIVNLSTGVPQRTRDFAARAAQTGARWLDAPVSGGVPAAKTGSLTLFVGGDNETIARAEPLLAAISRKRTHVGPPGAGQTMKLCNQMIVAANLLAIAEAVSTGRSAGIDVSQFTQALSGGFADSLPLQVFGPRMAGHIYEPRLGAIRLMLKDVDAACNMAREAGTVTPILNAAQAVYRSVEASSRLSLDQDLAAVVELFEKAGIGLD